MSKREIPTLDGDIWELTKWARDSYSFTGANKKVKMIRELASKKCNEKTRKAFLKVLRADARRMNYYSAKPILRVINRLRLYAEGNNVYVSTK